MAAEQPSPEPEAPPQRLPSLRRRTTVSPLRYEPEECVALRRLRLLRTTTFYSLRGLRPLSSQGSCRALLRSALHYVNRANSLLRRLICQEIRRVLRTLLVAFLLACGQ